MRKQFITFSASALGVIAAFAHPASGQSSTDPFQGATVVTASPFEGCCGGFPPTNIFGAFGGGEDGATTIFAAGGNNFVNFTTAQPVLLNGVELYNAADNGEDGFRGTSGFSLLADTNNDSTYETTIVNNVNPTDFGVVNQYFFAPVTASSFRAEFVGPNGGNRIRELDAIGQVVPEPAALSLLAIGGLALMGRRRRV